MSRTLPTLNALALAVVTAATLMLTVTLAGVPAARADEAPPTPPPAPIVTDAPLPATGRAILAPAPAPEPPSPFATLTKKNGQSMVMLDIAPLEISGELGRQKFDLKMRRGDDREPHFLGTEDVHGGQFYGGGLQLGVKYASEYGLRGGVELGIMGGRATNQRIDWDTTSVNLRARMVLGLGVQRRFGRFVLHTETQAGFDYAQFDVAGGAGARMVSSGFGPRGAQDTTYTLSRFSPRLGQQVGVHLLIAESTALFVQGSIDVDGQYRINAGLSIGTWK